MHYLKVPVIRLSWHEQVCHDGLEEQLGRTQCVFGNLAHDGHRASIRQRTVQYRWLRLIHLQPCAAVRRETSQGRANYTPQFNKCPRLHVSSLGDSRLCLKKHSFERLTEPAGDVLLESLHSRAWMQIGQANLSIYSR